MTIAGGTRRANPRRLGSRSVAFPFECRRSDDYDCDMTASGVIEEIKQLPRAEQSRVVRFAVELARERQLSGEKLSELARRMADSKDPAEAQKLREEIHRGFYGE